MKLLLTAWIFIVPTIAFSQSRDYTAYFAKDGKLQDIRLHKNAATQVSSYPTILFKGSIKMNLDDVEVKDSRYVANLSGLQKTLSDPNAPIIVQSLNMQIGADLTNLTSNIAAGNFILSYDATKNNLPIQTVAKATAKEIVCDGCPNSVFSKPDLFVFNGSTPIEDISYKIKLIDFDNEILSKHLKQTAGLYKGVGKSHENYLAAIQRKFKNQVQAINEQHLIDSLINKRFNIDLVKKIIQAQPYVRDISKIYDHTLSENEAWIHAWMWYTGGKIQLNPFNATCDTTLILSRIDQQLFELEQETTMWQNILKHDASKLEFVSKQIAIISGEISRLEMQRTNALALGPKFTAWRTQVSQKDKLLYSGSWQISSEDALQWIHHYDAADDYSSLSAKDSLPDKLSEADQVKVAVHNVKEGDKIELKSSLADFQPKSPLQMTLEEIEKSFEGNKSLASNISRLAGNLLPNPRRSNVMPIPKTRGRSYLRSNCQDAVRNSLKTLTYGDPHKNTIIDALVGKCEGEEFNKDLRNLASVDRPTFILLLFEKFGIEALDDYTIAINEVNLAATKLDWLLSQTAPVLQVELKADEKADFNTIVKSPEGKLEITDSKEVTYSIYVNGDKEAELTKKYKKYKQSRFLPTIGLAYVPKHRSASIFDETTGQFKSGTRFDNVEAFVGVKWYFWPKYKTNPVLHGPTSRLIQSTVSSDANLIRGNSFRTRFFLTGGLGVRHQFLRNYYLGVGGDIIPGINAHIGSNFIFRKRYSLENGKIISEQERPKSYVYFAISFDPGIIASLTKIFIN